MDTILTTLLEQIAAHPNDDAPRLAYAARLERLGRADVAVWLRHEIANPQEQTAPGADVGLPEVLVATSCRGFIREVIVSRGAAAGLGGLMAAHPIERIWIRDYLVSVAWGTPPADCWQEDTQRPVARQWVATIELDIPRRGGHLHVPLSTRAWAFRTDLVRGIGGWIEESLPKERVPLRPLPGVRPRRGVSGGSTEAEGE